MDVNKSLVCRREDVGGGMERRSVLSIIIYWQVCAMSGGSVAFLHDSGSQHDVLGPNPKLYYAFYTKERHKLRPEMTAMLHVFSP